LPVFGFLHGKQYPPLRRKAKLDGA